jgi:hypothetical protein
LPQGKVIVISIPDIRARKNKSLAPVFPLPGVNPVLRSEASGARFLFMIRSVPFFYNLIRKFSGSLSIYAGNGSFAWAEV